MKKIFSVIVLIMFIASVNLTAQAYQRRGTLPKSEMALGGITLKRNYWDEIRRIYGEPKNDSLSGWTWTYGDSVELHTPEGALSDILVTANNGWKTPSGIGVGTSVNELVKKYGEPYLSKSYSNKRVYCYCSGGNAYYPDDPFLFFLFDKNDKKITKILLSGNTARMADSSETTLNGGFMTLLDIDYKTYEKL